MNPWHALPRDSSTLTRGDSLFNQRDMFLKSGSCAWSSIETEALECAARIGQPEPSHSQPALATNVRSFSKNESLSCLSSRLVGLCGHF